MATTYLYGIRVKEKREIGNKSNSELTNVSTLLENILSYETRIISLNLQPVTHSVFSITNPFSQTNCKTYRKLNFNQ